MSKDNTINIKEWDDLWKKLRKLYRKAGFKSWVHNVANTGVSMYLSDMSSDYFVVQFECYPNKWVSLGEYCSIILPRGCNDTIINASYQKYLRVVDALHEIYEGV